MKLRTFFISYKIFIFHPSTLHQPDAFRDSTIGREVGTGSICWNIERKKHRIAKEICNSKQQLAKWKIEREKAL